MPYRNEVFVRDNYYHIYNRAESENLMFYDDEDYIYLLQLIKKYKFKCNITIICYCLMPNHYHFLLRPENAAKVSKFISCVFNCYVKAINKKYNRTGRLFVNRFKCRYVKREEHLIYLMRYIHRNPTKAGLVKDPKMWLFSNYLEYIGFRNGNLMDKNFINKYFNTSRRYREFVLDDDQVMPENFDKLIIE